MSKSMSNTRWNRAMLEQLIIKANNYSQKVLQAAYQNKADMLGPVLISMSTQFVSPMNYKADFSHELW